MAKNIIINILVIIIIAGGIFFWNSKNTENQEKIIIQRENNNQEKTNIKNENKNKENDTNNNEKDNWTGVNMDGINIAGRIKLNNDDNDTNTDQNNNSKDFYFNKNINNYLKNTDFSNIATLQTGSVWKRVNTNERSCDLTKLKILSQDGIYKKVELTTKSGEKFQASFVRNKNRIYVADVNYTTDTNNTKISSFSMDHVIKKGEDGLYHVLKNRIEVTGWYKNFFKCIDYFIKIN